MSSDIIYDDSFIQQHKAIRAHIQQILRLSEDIEKMKSTTSANMTPEQLKALNYTWQHMKNTFAYLADCLKVHWELEDRGLPKLIGDCIANSLREEHALILKTVTEINKYFLNNNPRELLISQDYLKDRFTHLNQMMLRHREKEDAIFDLHKARP